MVPLCKALDNLHFFKTLFRELCLGSEIRLVILSSTWNAKVTVTVLY